MRPKIKKENNEYVGFFEMGVTMPKDLSDATHRNQTLTINRDSYQVTVFRTDKVYALVDTVSNWVLEYGGLDLMKEALKNTAKDYGALGLEKEALQVVEFSPKLSAEVISAAISDWKVMSGAIRSKKARIVFRSMK